MLVYGRRNEQRTGLLGSVSADRKAGPALAVRGGETCRDDKLIREVIQCTSQVVDRVAEDQRELGRDIWNVIDPKDVLAALVVVLITVASQHDLLKSLARNCKSS
jgi:hypothetical protein